MAYPHYDPSRKALLTPARDAVFFPDGRPSSEGRLCAELSRLAYSPFERDPAAEAGLTATLRGIGFDTCTVFNSASTEGFLAHDTTRHLAVLVFRGTELDPKDWATDLNTLPVPWATGGKVHQGFGEALSAVWEAVAAALAPVRHRLLFTGHSLGAALATLAASRRTPDALYTYGSPRVGDAAFVSATASIKHHRYVNCCDLVCRLPPEALTFRHTGPLSYLDRRGVLHRDPPEELVRRDQRRARLSYAWRWSWQQGTLWTRDAADHSPVNYLSALAPTGEG